MVLINCYEIMPLSCFLELARMFFILFGNEPAPMLTVMQSLLKHTVTRTMKQMSASGNPSDYSDLIATFFQVFWLKWIASYLADVHKLLAGSKNSSVAPLWSLSFLLEDALSELR